MFYGTEKMYLAITVVAIAEWSAAAKESTISYVMMMTAVLWLTRAKIFSSISERKRVAWQSLLFHSAGHRRSARHPPLL